MQAPSPRVAVVGNGYVGTVLAACLAKLGRRVVGLEIDRRKLEQLSQGRVPFFEPGLEDLVAEGLRSNPHIAWDDVIAFAAEAGVSRMVRLGVLLAVDVLDAAIPPAIDRWGLRCIAGGYFTLFVVLIVVAR